MSEPHERAAEVLAGTFLGILQQMEERGIDLSHIAVVAVVDDKVIHGHHVRDGDFGYIEEVLWYHLRTLLNAHTGKDGFAIIPIPNRTPHEN